MGEFLYQTAYNIRSNLKSKILFIVLRLNQCSVSGKPNSYSVQAPMVYPQVTEKHKARIQLNNL